MASHYNTNGHEYNSGPQSQATSLHDQNPLGSAAPVADHKDLTGRAQLSGPLPSPALIDFGPMAGLPDHSTETFDTTPFDTDLPELSPSEIETWLQQVMHQEQPAPLAFPSRQSGQ